MNIVALLEELVNSLFEAEDKFLSDPKDFHSLEKAAKSSPEAFAAAFLGEVFSSVGRRICDSSWRNGRYNIQRKDSRTVISSVGDVTFDCTYFKSKSTGKYAYLLEDLIGEIVH